MESGPSAEKGDDLRRASATSLLSSGSWSENGLRIAETGREVLRGKKWLSNASLIWVREVASGRLGNLGSTLPMANFFAIHIEWGVASARKDFQYLALAALIAFK